MTGETRIPAEQVDEEHDGLNADVNEAKARVAEGMILGLAELEMTLRGHGLSVVDLLKHVSRNHYGISL